MSIIPQVTRRSFLATSAAAGALSSVPASVHAAADMMGASQQIFSRFKLGSFEVTTLLDGERQAGNPQQIFGMNVDAEEFSDVSRANMIPSDKTQFYFTPTVVNTGKELVLFDTGLGESGNLRGALDAAGYKPEQIDVVVITHMHPDHIGGLMIDGKETFPNARYVAPSAEYDFWKKQSGQGRIGELFAAKVEPLSEKTSFIKDADSPVSGITAVSCHGHTPGHTAFMIEDGGKSVLLFADLANHYVWSLAYPDWEVKFDMDKAEAAKSRRKILGMLASDGIPCVGYHMPFPAVGYVQSADNGFKYIPASYQLKL
ncbi:MAG: MBL fold metallo-hydrolase [Pseudomonadota bacterium]